MVRVFFSESQSQSPKGFIRVVCGSQSLERAKRRSQSGISGCGHGRWVVPHGRHVSEPEGGSLEREFLVVTPTSLCVKCVRKLVYINQPNTQNKTNPNSDRTLTLDAFTKPWITFNDIF